MNTHIQIGRTTPRELALWNYAAPNNINSVINLHTEGTHNCSFEIQRATEWRLSDERSPLFFVGIIYLY